MAAVSDGWIERTRPRRGRTLPEAPARRSLKDALSDAGLAVQSDDDDRARSSQRLFGASRAERLRERLLGFVPDYTPQEPPSPAPTRTEKGTGVVSPPPWLREARRGRRRQRALNAVSWVMTIAVVGVAIGLAGHLLGVVPSGLNGIQWARQ